MDDWSKEDLLKELKKKEEENKTLRKKLEKYEESNIEAIQANVIKDVNDFTMSLKKERELTHWEVARYSRQLILPDVGPSGQKKLIATSVLIVGCGGLGCPAAIYLGAAGVGRLGLIDYDDVELSNLHRQVLHTEGRVGTAKAVSVAASVKALNSNVEVIPFDVTLSSETALQIISKFDIILDCTDNVATRYLINDACVMANKPLVSGSALRYEGQLTVYHLNDGPCFRCILPKPPPPETVTNCSDGGVMGVIPGIIGCLQALETIKIIVGNGTTLSQKLLIFDGLEGMFRTVKLRKHKSTCEVCGDDPSITQLIDYEQFCGSNASDKDKGLDMLTREKRVNVKEYKAVLDNGTPHLLIDVRLPVEQEICKLPNALNIPFKDVSKPERITLIKDELSTLGTKNIYCLCRRGNDSQRAVSTLQSLLPEDCVVKDIIGGLTAWAQKIDDSFPVY